MKKNDPYFLLYNKLEKSGYGKLFCYFEDILQLNLRDKSVTIIVKKLMYDEDITIAYRQNAFYDYWLHEMLLGILKTCDLKSVCILFDE